MYKTKNILFIGEPHSVHDIKWMTYFSANEKYKVYLLSEHHHLDDFVEDEKRMAALNIEFLGNISSFSIRNAHKTFKAIKTIRAHIRSKQIDFVHFLFATPYTLWALFLPIPYVITTRGSDVLIVLPYLLRKKGLAAFRNNLLFNLFRIAFLKASLITSTSNQQIIRIKELFGSGIDSHLVRTGVPVATISSSLPLDNLPTGRKIIFSPRYFNPVYGIELQLAAIEIMDQEFLDQLHFIFIKGIQMGNAYADKLENKLHVLKNKRGVSYELIYEIDQAKMFRIFRSSSLTLLTPASDGTPNTALEAMAAHSPLIIPNLPYDKELFNDRTSHILKERKPETLIELMKYVLQNDVSEITNHAYETVLKYGNRDVEMDKLAKLYEQKLK